MPEPVADSLLISAVNRQLSLVRYQEGEVARILRILRRSEADLRLQIQRSIERRKQSTPTGLRLRLIRQELRRLLREIYSGLETALMSGLDGLAERTVERVAGDLADALPFVFDTIRPDPGLLKAIASSNPFQGKLLHEHFQALEIATQQRFIQAVEVGMTLGETGPQIARRVMGSTVLKNGLSGGVIDVSRQQAAVLTRTAIQHVHAEARDSLYAGNLDVIKAVMGVVTLDERTCRICGPRDGLVWSLPDHRPIGHSEPWGSGPGRWHFQCRCTSIPVLRDADEIEDAGYDLSELAAGERAAMNAPVSVDLDYGDWLSQQSLEVRQRVLGKRRASWWASNPGKTLDDAWGKRFGGTPVEPLSLSEL